MLWVGHSPPLFSGVCGGWGMKPGRGGRRGCCARLEYVCTPAGLWASERLARCRGSVQPINFPANHAGHSVIRALASPVGLASQAGL